MLIQLACALLSIAALTGMCGPGWRAGHTLGYNAQRGELVLYGGCGAAMTPQGDTWLYDGQAWRHIQATATPPARSGHVMAYDAERNVIVLYGGEGERGELFGDTWEFDGVTWRQVLISSPPPRTEAAMAFDSARGVCVLYGGQGQATLPLSDTWEYDGSIWRQVATGHAPSGITLGAGLRGHALAYDAARQVVVLFGGNDGAYDSGNTWAYDGEDWAQQLTLASPFPRHGHAMAYDVVEQCVILYGGWHNGPLADAYAWTGDRWTPMSAGVEFPPARSHHALAYDAELGALVLYGGLGVAGQPMADMWAFDAQGWHELAPAICANGLYLPYVQR